ncbi:unnamed protein product [Linum trigynum]
MVSITKLLRRRQRSGSRFRRLQRGGGVPGDVKKGHFAVEVKNSNGGDEVTTTTTARRVVVPLRCLRNPQFVKMMDQAAGEYGFRCQGTVTVCCRPADLEAVLAFCLR